MPWNFRNCTSSSENRSASGLAIVWAVAPARVGIEVLEAMLQFLTERWGNPSSAYAFGNEVTKQIEAARAKAGALINTDSREVVFTSCGTESNNSAIHSALMTNPAKRHVVTTAVEHSANIKFCELLQK